MSHVSHINESCLIYEWVMSYVWRSHVSCMNESCLTYEYVMSNRDTTQCEMQCTSTLTHIHTLHTNSYTYKHSLFHTRTHTHTHAHACIRTHSHAHTHAHARAHTHTHTHTHTHAHTHTHTQGHDRACNAVQVNFRSAVFLVGLSVYEWHDSFICVTWLILTWLLRMCFHIGGMTHSWVRYDSFVCLPCRCTFICVTWLIHSSDMTYS